jgi:hypothetical protein
MLLKDNLSQLVHLKWNLMVNTYTVFAARIQGAIIQVFSKQIDSRYEYEKLYFSSRVNLSALQVMLLSTGALHSNKLKYTKVEY